MKKTATILAALAMSVASASAGVAPAPVDKNPVPPPPPPVDPCAGPISYNIELLYANTDWGFEDGDSSDGGIVRLEWSPFANFYIAGGFEYHDMDFGDAWTGTIGIGGYFPLTQNIHIAADGGYVYGEFDFDDFDPPIINPLGDIIDDDDDDNNSVDGWYVRPHIRAKWGCFSAKAGAIYRDLTNDSDDNGLPGEDDVDDGEWAFFVQAYYQFAHNWDITAGYLGGENEFDQWNAGVRFRW